MRSIKLELEAGETFLNYTVHDRSGIISTDMDVDNSVVLNLDRLRK